MSKPIKPEDALQISNFPRGSQSFSVGLSERFELVLNAIHHGNFSDKGIYISGPNHLEKAGLVPRIVVDDNGWTLLIFTKKEKHEARSTRWVTR